MFIPFGIVLLVAGAILTFAIDRRVDGVDVQLAGWIVMAGGGLSLIVAMIRGAAKPPAGDLPDDGHHPSLHRASLHRADDRSHRSAGHPEHRPVDQLADDERRRAA